jgi:hypothetical protein
MFHLAPAPRRRQARGRRISDDTPTLPPGCTGVMDGTLG